jgi:hypothetical protein
MSATATRTVDLSALSAPQIAVSHPYSLAAMTKIVARRPGDAIDSELMRGEPAAFELWQPQRELLQLMMTRRRVIVLKARQLGVTWAMALHALWYAMAHPASQVLVVSIGEREAWSFMRRIRRMYDFLPESVQAAFPITSDTREAMMVGHHDGATMILSLPSSSTAGRGETTNLAIFDEGAHWEDADARMASLLPTVEDVGQVVLASTANGVGGVFYDTWQEHAERRFSRLFIGALGRPDRDEDFVVAARARLGVEGPQEYPRSPSEAFLSTGRCAFDTRALQTYLDMFCEPARRRGAIEKLGNMVAFEETTAPVQREYEGWKVWSWRVPGRDYLIVADVCGGPGAKDWSTASVIDMDSWDEVASFRGKPDPSDFATLLIRAAWLWKHSDDEPALLAPEANNEGRAVIAVLRERSFSRVWSMATFDQDRTDRVEQKGWLTTMRSRPIALAALKEGVRDHSLGIRDAATIAEMLTFEANPKTGKEQARDGCHDDRVMKWAIAAAILQRAAAAARPRAVTLAELRPYRQPRSLRTGY